ncbi:MAG: hypothetical protein U5K27_20925 [Desulfotignum sp.]|nr:hypothetical protein [Desulfotignum sp.]
MSGKILLNMMQFIDKTFPDFKNFTSVELKEYLETINEEGTKEARILIDAIQKKLYNTVVAQLKLEYPEDENEWWYSGIPDKVRKSCSDKTRRRKRRKKSRTISGFDQ